MTNHRYLSYSDFLESKYGFRIYRVGVDADFSCPNRFGCRKEGGCVYCDSQGASSAYLRTQESSFSHKSTFTNDIDSLIGEKNINNIKDQIERGRSFLVRRYKAEHFALYFQSFSNTFAPVSKLKQIYESALEGYSWDGLIISTRPDCIDEEKLRLISSYRERGLNVSIELGLQSGDDEILRAMNRGHDVKCCIDAAKLVKKFGIELCTHILLGFPNEGQVQLDRTIDVINSVHPDAIKIHNLNITANTRLYDMYRRGLVSAPCAKRHIQRTVYLLRRIPSDIVIERLICETPSHRLASPRLFPDKNMYLRRLDDEMERQNVRQGDLFKSNFQNQSSQISVFQVALK